MNTAAPLPITLLTSSLQIATTTMSTADGPLLVPLRLESIRIAFLQLGRRVEAALHTQIGDRLRLHEQNNSVLLLLNAIHQVKSHPLNTLSSICTNIASSTPMSSQ